MGSNCFFCDVQKSEDDQKITENEYFFARYDDFPVSEGHCEIISIDHLVSFFDLTPEQVQSMYELIKKTKKIIDEKFGPDGYNIGINEGEVAGRTLNHLHVHLIPRYNGDVENPRGGVRNIIPEKADYTGDVEERFPERKVYFK